MKSRRYPVSPLGIEHRYRAPWWIRKLCWFHKISWPSSLEVCSARSAFKSVFFCTSQSNTVLNIRSSFWAATQSVTCICTSVRPALTHTSCSKWQLTLTMAGSWTSAQCADPNATPLKIEFTVSMSSWVVTWLSTSTTVLSLPFWYFQLKIELLKGTDPAVTGGI